MLFVGLGPAGAGQPGAAPEGAQGRATREITVWVGDPDRRAVIGAGVEVLAGYRPIAAGLTDAEGKAVVSVPVDAPVQWVVALKRGVGFDYSGVRPDAPNLVESYPPAVRGSDLHGEVTLTLEHGRTIRIAAVDEKGTHVQGVRLVPWIMHMDGKDEPVNLSGSGLAAATTDERGVAVFDWIPADGGDLPGATFIVQGGDYHWAHPPPQPFASGDDAEVTAVLAPKSILRGQVRYPDGDPAPGITVLAQGRGNTAHFGRDEAHTDAEGRYSLLVAPEQTYTLTVVDTDWTARLDGVAVLTGTTFANADLTLSRGTMITGRVSDGAGGEPVAGALMYLAYETLAPGDSPRDTADDWWSRYERVALHRDLLTDEEGRFAFRVPPGRYQLCATEARLGDGSPRGSIHRPVPVVIESEGAPRLVEYAFTGARSGPFVSSFAPVKANEEPAYDYAFEWVALEEQPDSCIQCHSPSRRQGVASPARAHGW